MRKDYNIIKDKFNTFIHSWKTKETEDLENLVITDIHAFLSTVNNKEGEQHTIFGIRDFIKEIPDTDCLEYDICHFVCRLNDKKAHQSAEVAFVASNQNGDRFVFVATFCNVWVKVAETWKLAEIRMDVKDYETPLRDYFAEKWYFEEPLANLTASVHLPCIFPDLDTPYFRIPEMEDILTEEEKIKECFAKFCYGIDWIIFKYCKESMHDNFENDEKHHFIAATKFARQRFRYWCSPYSLEITELTEDKASAKATSLVPDCKINRVDFVKENGKWQIIRYSEGA